MPSPIVRTYSRYTLEALRLLGGLLRAARIEKRIGTRDLAARAGISRDTLHRIEKGDPRCEIGVVFELAAILGVPLFAPEESTLRTLGHALEERLTLLPKAVRGPTAAVNDDF